MIAGILLLIGSAITPIVATVTTFAMPAFFSSTARILSAVDEPTASATEVEVIRSQAVLLPVLTNLDLARKYAREFNLGQEIPMDLLCDVLSHKSVIKRVKGTRVIEITVLSKDRMEAAAIANEIALVYTKSSLAAKGADPKAVPQIIDTATPGLRPAVPNIPLNIASGMGIGALLALIGIWLIWRHSVRRASATGQSKRVMKGGQPPPLLPGEPPP